MGTFGSARRAQLLLLLVFVAACTTPVLGYKSYVVYMGGRPTSRLPAAAHYDMLESVMGSTAANKAILYSYKSFNGFAAKLSSDEAAALEELDEVVAVFPNIQHHLHTTHSWEFLGLESQGKVAPSSLWNKSNYGKDVIIGVLDSGVWPESESFRDDGLGPIPSRWKGACDAGDAFDARNCNRKLIGGRFYLKGFEAEEGPLNTSATGDYRSARDLEGHGTHTTSTAGGNFVSGANTLGFAKGTAKGGAPHSRVAMYKVCWPSALGGGCYTSDILAAFDQGIADGVDVFSMSLGSNPPLPAFFKDGIAVGAFHAVQKGITVVASAGNAGPRLGTVGNVPPWIITVAASSIDRDFPAFVILGNNVRIQGESLADAALKDEFYPLVSGGAVHAADVNSTSGTLCLPGSLDSAKVKGKIVACLRGVTARVDKGQVVKAAGGVGLILINPPESGNELVADPHVVPAVSLGSESGAIVYEYIAKTECPVAKLTLPTTLLGVKPAPVRTAFSSQGPNTAVPDILKPDITGPGLNILAAFTQRVSITDLPGDNRIVKFNIISGTSMSCPHVAGVAALLKALYPNWSPAAIHSAIVTSASQLDNEKKPIKDISLAASTPFGVGGGHINPNAAADPGLIYDNSPADYFPFFCSLGYSRSNIRAISGQDFSCPSIRPSVSDHNYPSLTVSNLGVTKTVKRTVTNVGSPTSSYSVTVAAPPGVGIAISPCTLKFSALGEKKSFYVTLTRESFSSHEYAFGSFTWSDGSHCVRSPIVVKTSGHRKKSGGGARSS